MTGANPSVTAISHADLATLLAAGALLRDGAPSPAADFIRPHLEEVLARYQAVLEWVPPAGEHVSRGEDDQPQPAPGTALYLAAIARLSAALREIRDTYPPGHHGHDVACAALDATVTPGAAS
jgi:hypothetical protein